jgi:hypothetical protein
VRRIRWLAAAAFVVASLGLQAVPAAGGPARVIVSTTAGQKYAPPMIVVPQGASLMLLQLDPSARHDVVSRYVVRRRPMFATARTLGFGEALMVTGVEKLKPATYPFTCSIHNWMSGQLIVR